MHALTRHPPLAQARVLVVGVGGLGAPAAEALAATGVGSLALVDPDVVELSNLHRQPLYTTADAGRPKVEVAAERLRAAHPGLRVEQHRLRFAPEHAALFGGSDVVLDGTDTIAAKFVVSDAAVAAGVPLVHAGVVGFRAQLFTVLPGASACYRCVFEVPPPPGDVPSCAEAGVLGPTAALAGSLQAAEALRVLVGQPTLVGRLLTIDVLAGRHRLVPLAPNLRCPACATARAGVAPRSEAP